MFVTIHFVMKFLWFMFFFQMYKYFLKDILLFMSYLISLHMKKNASFQFFIFINNTYFTQIIFSIFLQYLT
jgi:hypothetical protein